MTISFNTHKLSLMVDDIKTEFEASKLVVIHIPTFDNSDEWANLVCANINRNINSNFDYMQQYEFDSNNQPHDLKGEVFAEQDGTFIWDTALEDNGHSKPVYIWINMEVHDENWDSFFDEMVRAYQSWNRDYYCKKIVLILLGLKVVPTWVKSPAVRYFQFWNVMSWEEMRTLAKGWLVEDNNPYFKEWQIASYVGASKLDPFLLNQLCLRKPDNFNSIKEEIELISYNKKLSNTKFTPNFFGETWLVPAELEDNWLSGQLSAFSLDRGGNESWSSIEYTHRESILIQSIWSEQVVSLFQIIARLSDISAEKVTKSLGSDEWKQIARSLDGGYINEPAVIIKVLNENNFCKLPTKLWNFLHQLRSVRNSLAHREYIDGGAMRRLLSFV